MAEGNIKRLVKLRKFYNQLRQNAATSHEGAQDNGAKKQWSAMANEHGYWHEADSKWENVARKYGYSSKTI